MKLYRVKTEFWGKDLSEKATLGYVVADSEEEVAEHINQKHTYGEWFLGIYGNDDPEEMEITKQDYLANKGDIHTEYAGEFYDQKYGWEEIGEVTDEQIAVLRDLGITQELSTASK